MEATVQVTIFDYLIMCSIGNDPSFLKYENSIRKWNRAEPVGDDKDGLVFYQVL